MANEDFALAVDKIVKAIEQLSRIAKPFSEDALKPGSDPLPTGAPSTSHVADISEGVGRIADGLAEIARAIEGFAGPADADDSVVKPVAIKKSVNAERHDMDVESGIDEFGFPFWLPDDPDTRSKFKAHLRDIDRHERMGKERPEVPEFMTGPDFVIETEEETEKLPDRHDDSVFDKPFIPVDRHDDSVFDRPFVSADRHDDSVFDKPFIPAPMDSERSPSGEDPHGLGDFAYDVQAQEEYGQTLHTETLERQQKAHQSEVHLWEEQLAFNERVAKDVANLHRRAEWTNASFEQSLETLTDTNV